MESLYSNRESVELPHGVAVPREVAEDPEKRRNEFLIRVIELADDFDSLDHRFGPEPAGTELRDDCRLIREFVRGTLSPRLDTN